MKNYLYCFALIFLLSCSDNDIPRDAPDCVKKVIEGLKKDPVSKPPAKVYQYQYEGRTVYYLPPACCDGMSTLMDDNCNVICSPDGGITGAGDTKCPEFFKKATNQKLIWEDSRK